MDMQSRFFGREVQIFGRNAVIGTAWESLYQYDQDLDFRAIFAAGITLDVSSSSANDTAAGTGARTLTLYGLDTSYYPQVEVITMNGQTAVTSTKTWLRLFGATISSAGTGLVNAGDIHIVKTGTGGTYTGGVPGTLTSAVLKILAGWCTSEAGHYTVPAGAVYRLTGICASGYTQAAVLGIFVQPNGETDTYRGLDFLTGFGNQGWICPDLEKAGYEYKEKTDILMRVLGAAASAVVQATMHLKRVT